jgi:DNA repair protein RadA/Sms
MTDALANILKEERRYTPSAFKHFGVSCLGMSVQIPLWGEAGNRTYNFTKPHEERMSGSRNVKASLFGDFSGDSVILVEGEWDLFSAYEAGIANVATPTNGAGTFTKQMAELLSGKAITIVYDCDEAGKRGASKAAEMLIEQGCKVKILELPYPPDSKKDLRDFLTSNTNPKEAFELLEKGSVWQSEVHDSSSEKIVSQAISMNKVTSKEVNWLWFPYVAKRFVTSLIGDPGCGKSRLVVQLASAISNGGEFWNEAQLDQGKVLLLSSEDPIEEVLKPRLESAKANMENVFALNAQISFDEIGQVAIREMVNRFQPSLLVIDPIVSYLGGATNMNSANEVRVKMNFLGDIARTGNLAVLIVRHLNKGKNEKAIYSGNGSIDFVAACRSEVMLAKDPDNKSRRLFGQTKNNLSKEGDSLSLEMSQEGLIFLRKEARNLDDIIRSESAVSAKDDGLLNVRNLAIETLKDGPMLTKAFFEMLESGGYPKRTVERALSEEPSIFKISIKFDGAERGAGVWIVGVQNHLEAVKARKFGGVEALQSFLQSVNLQDRQNSAQNRDGVENE